MATREKDVVERAIARVDEQIRVEYPVRSLALKARRFVTVPGAQWEDAWGEQFEHSIKVEINKTARGWNRINTDYLAKRIVPTFRNVGKDADEHTAATIGGVHRADSYHFKAQQARDNAFIEGSQGGFGAWRLTTAYADETDPNNDEQRINPALIITDADQCVYFDGDSKLYDKSDAKWGAILIGKSPDAFHDEYPKAREISWPSEMPAPFYEWYRPDRITVCEYYEKQEVSELLYIFTQGISGEEQRWWESELADGDRAELKAQGFTYKTQKRKRVRVKKWVLSGAEVLEEGRFIAGSEIPIIPYYGNRAYIDGIEYFTGHVQQAMDPQRIYNAQISKLAETSALAPREVPIFLAEQMPPNIAEIWKNMNIERHAYAVVNPVIDADGKYIAMGPIGKVEAPQLQPADAALIQITAADIAELTNADDGADEAKANTSAEAMDLAATRTDAKSYIYTDHMRQSVQREGEVYQGMARDVYFEEGRVLDTIGDDGSDGEETLMEGWTNPNTGQYSIRNDLSRGKYKVIADVTEATSTLRDKTVRQLNGVATLQVEAGDQEGAQASLITMVANMDGEGLTEYQDWNRQRGLKMGLFKPTPEEKAAMEQAAQADAEPSPTDKLVLAEADKTAAEAKTEQATAVEKLASAELKRAQATVVGAPVSAPEVPSGFDHIVSLADVRDRLAGADLKRAQADKIRREPVERPSAA